jgi:hypothetical protein
MRVSHRWEKHEDESAKKETEKNGAEERAAEHGRPKVRERARGTRGDPSSLGSQAIEAFEFESQR